MNTTHAPAIAGKSVLYISYNGMLDPLGQSQVIPYLKELGKKGVRFWLMSFERAHAFTEPGKTKAEKLRQELAQHGIEWHVLRYHQKPSLPATAYDVTAGVRLGAKLIRKNGMGMVHARAQIPAVIALRLKQRLGVRMIFDVRGLMAEEYIDAGHWKARGAPARVAKTMEARALRAADGVVTLTQALWQSMRSWPALKDRNVPHEVIPCCIDLQRFRFDQRRRDARRSELGIANRFVLVYSGSVGGWYMTNEMAQFFRALKQREPRAFFLWLTHGPQTIVSEAMQHSGIAPTDFAVKKIEPAAVAEYLMAADAGIAFYRPGISRLGTSPVKVSEYLACGLPVVINSGIGDCDQLFAGSNAGVVVREFGEQAYSDAATVLAGICRNQDKVRGEARELAERYFDLNSIGVNRYARLYEEVFSS
jgi:glycosyltransferase involved in cell wall biosynthesis